MNNGEGVFRQYRRDVELNENSIIQFSYCTTSLGNNRPIFFGCSCSKINECYNALNGVCLRSDFRNQNHYPLELGKNYILLKMYESPLYLGRNKEYDDCGIKTALIFDIKRMMILSVRWTERESSICSVGIKAEII